MSRKLLIISPTSREYRELPAVAARLGCQLIFDDFAGTFFDDVLGKNDIKDVAEIIPLIEETISRYKGSRLSGVTSGVGYPGMPVAAIVAERLGLCGPRVDRVLLCEHKYYSRLAQRELVPCATPDFGLIDPLCPRLPTGMRFPLFVKPVKSCFSINARRVSDEDELRGLVAQGAMPEAFLKPFDQLLGNYTDFELGSSYCLAESPLEGVQVSLEGYVFHGRAHTLGIVDAIMYPGTISFRRFQYPSSLGHDVQRRMSQIAETFINGIGYDNAFFNVELIHNPLTDEIYIVEVNPKIASQFTDLFEKVDGASSYSPLLQIALGAEPEFPQGHGPYKLAASCVLRTFEDRRVLRVPSAEEIEALRERFPDTRVEVTVQEERLLSDVMQDGKSFRYCVINIGANSPEELEAKTLKSWLASHDFEKTSVIPTYLFNRFDEVYDFQKKEECVVAKPIWGGASTGVRKLAGEIAVRDFVRELDACPDLDLSGYCFQVFRHGDEKRLWFAGGKFVGGRGYRGRETPWPGWAQDFRLYVYGRNSRGLSDEQAAAVRLCKLSGIGFGSVDFIGDEINEINGAGTVMTTFQGRKLVMDVRPSFIEYFVRLAESL